MSSFRPIVVALCAWIGSALPGQVPELLENLRANKAETRQAALEAIAEMGPEAVPMLEVVVLKLADRNEDVRKAAVAATMKLRPDLGGARGRLVEMIDIPAFDSEQWNSAIGLGGGAGGVPRLQLLRAAERLGDEDPRVRAEAVQRLCRFGSAAASYRADVLALLADDDARVRRAVAEKITHLGWDEAVRDGLVLALRDAEAGVRAAAAGSLGWGHNDAVVVTALRGVLQDPDQLTRVAAVRAIGNSGKAGRAAADDLVATLRDNDAVVRLAALSAVADLGLRSERAVKETLRALDETHAALVLEALRATATMGRAAADGLDRVLELTRHELGDVRSRALSTAGKIAFGERRGAVVVRGIELMLDDDEAVRSSAEGFVRRFIERD